MRKSIFNALILIAVLLLSIALTVLYALPKAVLVDRYLMGEGITLIARGAQESLTSVKLTGVRVFHRSEELTSLEELRLSFRPSGIRLKGVCSSGYADLVIGWSGEKELIAEGFSCLKGVGKVEGKLSLGEGVRGRLSVRNVSLRGVELESLDLEFRGSEFSGRLSYMGMELKGKGKIELNEENPLRSEVSARFSGGLGTLVVSGRLGALRAEIR